MDINNNKEGEERALLLSPLKQSKHSKEEENEGATTYQTSINISKCCMGTGTLALPYAASQGGLLFNTIGIAFISLWNLYSVNCLIKCSKLIDDSYLMKDDYNNNKTDEEFDNNILLSRAYNCCRYNHRRHPPAGTSTLGKVAWYSFGPFGLYFLDIMMIILLSGVVICYEDAAISFLEKTPISSKSKFLDALCTMIFIIPLSCLPNVGFLSKYSALGLLAILLSFLIIYSYGIQQNGWDGISTITIYDLYPQSIHECSAWFGIIVFSFGIVPVTYNLQESMKKPAQMKHATTIALIMVFILYIVIGSGVFIIYAPSLTSNDIKHHFNGDVLQHLPAGIIPTCIRLAMTGVIIVSAPLLIIPCAELLEGKMLIQQSSSTFYYMRIFLRIMICMICTSISVFVPDFVSIVSFIGCFAVAFVSFILPPLFYVVLSYKMLLQQLNNHDGRRNNTISLQNSYGSIITNSTIESSLSPTTTTTATTRFCDKVMIIKYHLFDCFMILFGVLATIIATYLTFQDLK